MTVIPIVSFPKSGNTYLRFLLVNCLKSGNEPITFQNINDYSLTTFNASVEEKQKIKKRLLPGSPLLIKTHKNFSEVDFHEYTKVLYVYRNLKQVINSYYHFSEAQKPRFFRSKLDFVKNYWSYCGLWGAHLESWLKLNNESSFELMKISYEELLTNPSLTLERIFQFLDISVSKEKIIESIELSSKENLRKFSSVPFMQSKSNKYHFVRDKMKFQDIVDSKIEEIYLKENLAKIWLNKLYNENHRVEEMKINKIRFYPSIWRRHIINIRYRFYHLRHGK